MSTLTAPAPVRLDRAERRDTRRAAAARRDVRRGRDDLAVFELLFDAEDAERVQ